MEEADALPHLLHSDQVTVIAIAHGPDRDVELQPVVQQIGMGLAQIVFDPAAAQVWSAQAVIDRHVLRDHADVLRSVHEDAVAREQFFRLVEIDHDFVQKPAALVHPAGRQVAGQAADAGVGGGEPRAGQCFDEAINLFPLGEREEKHGQGANVHGKSAQAQQMRRDAGQFAADDPDELAARRQLLVDAKEFFDRQRISDIVGQRRQVIEPVRVRDELAVGHVLGDLFVAAMQITDVRHRFGDDFAVEFQDNAEHAVRGGVRRPHVQHHLFALHVL